jgi:predicted MFS family arabinose efflux permease
VTEASASRPGASGAANPAGLDAVAGVSGDRASGQRRRPGVWQNQAFRLLWAGQTVSTLGSFVTTIAVPLLAIISLHASVADMGVLGTVIRLPFLLYLAAGVWVDRTRRRPVLISTDLGRAALLLSIPIAALTHLLTLPLLFVVVFSVMVLGVWFDVAYLSYVPALVERHELTTANTIMEASSSTAQVAGQSLGGFLVQLLTAPIAIVVDSVSYLISAVAVWRIRKPEPPLAAREGSGVRQVVSSIAAGVRYVVRDRILGPLALAIGIYNLFGSAELALYVFYLANGLRLNAGVIGLTLAAAGPGAVAGAALAGKAQRTLGVAVTIITALTLFAAAAWLIPLAPRDRVVAVPMLMAAQFLMGAGLQLCNINVITTRQTITPRELLGRVTASSRFLAFGTAPFGSMLGGLLGATLGARGGLFVAVAGLILPPVIVLASPVRRLRRLPGPGDHAGQTR